jgi:hypothetical protein
LWKRRQAWAGGVCDGQGCEGDSDHNQLYERP